MSDLDIFVDHLKKQEKIYFQPEKGEKVPEGSKIGTGPRGGKYYTPQTTGKGKTIIDSKANKYLQEFRRAAIEVLDWGKQENNPAFNLLQDYTIIAFGGKVPENHLDIHLSHASNTLEAGTGDPGVRLRTEDEWREWFKENRLNIDEFPEFRVWKLIESAKNYRDKAIALDSYISLEHQNGLYLNHIKGYPIDEESGYDEGIAKKLLDYLASEEQTMEKSFIEIRKKNRNQHTLELAKFKAWIEKQTPQSRGLVPKKIRVEREGKTFESTRWIRPKVTAKIGDETNINTHLNTLLNRSYTPPEVRARIQKVFNSLPKELQKEIVKIKKMYPYPESTERKKGLLASVNREWELMFNLELFSLKSEWLVYLALIHELTHVLRGDVEQGRKIISQIGVEEYKARVDIQKAHIDMELATIKSTIKYIKEIKELTSVQKGLCTQQQKDYAESLKYTKTELDFKEFCGERDKVLVPYEK